MAQRRRHRLEKESRRVSALRYVSCARRAATLRMLACLAKEVRDPWIVRTLDDASAIAAIEAAGHLKHAEGRPF